MKKTSKGEATEIPAMSMSAAMAVPDIPIEGRRSYTSPNEIEVEIDNRSRSGSDNAVSERNELMSSSFFDEEEGQGCEVGR